MVDSVHQYSMDMTIKNNTSHLCPSCKQKVSDAKTKKTQSLFPHDGMIRDVGSGQYVYQLKQYHWACDNCLSSGKALLAKPKKQYYTFRTKGTAALPFLAYYDINYTCDRCNDDFSFSKKEQQHWYEELRFVVHSRPRQCMPCRQIIRQEKALNAELSQLLKSGEPQDISSLSRLIELYEILNKADKVAYYSTLLKKKQKK